MVLISKKLIDSEIYASWKCSMQIALFAKNKLVIVTGDCSLEACQCYGDCVDFKYGF